MHNYNCIFCAVFTLKIPFCRLKTGFRWQKYVIRPISHTESEQNQCFTEGVFTSAKAMILRFPAQQSTPFTPDLTFSPTARTPSSAVQSAPDGSQMSPHRSEPQRRFRRFWDCFTPEHASSPQGSETQTSHRIPLVRDASESSRRHRIHPPPCSPSHPIFQPEPA